MRLPPRPLIYEINTWVWLNELSRKHGTAITLATVPDEEWAELIDLGVDAVWLMGVWERSPAGIRIAMQNEGLMASFRFLGRRPSEAPDESLKEFYRRLLRAVGGDVCKSGEWLLCECHGWPDNPSFRSLLAWSWRRGEDFRLVAVNFSDCPSQGLVRLLREEVSDKSV